MKGKLKETAELIKAGDTTRARELLIDILKSEPANDTAWVWMATVVEADELRQKCLNEALKHNPRNKMAKRILQEMQAQGRIWMTSSPRGPIEKPGLKATGLISIGLTLVFGIACVVVAVADLVPQAGSASTPGPLFWFALVPGLLFILLAVMLMIGTASLMKNPPSREEIKRWKSQNKKLGQALARSIYPGGLVGGLLWGIVAEWSNQDD